jgi:hypothetical protein
MADSQITGVVTTDGKPLGGAYVRLIGPSGEFVSEQYTKDEGKFVFYVAPGAWTVEVRAAGRASSTKTVDVEHEQGPVLIDLQPA